MKNKDELINYRRKKAKETLEDAKILLKAKRFSSAVNRIYYALFYEVVALLLTRNLSSRKHSGVRALFNVTWGLSGKNHSNPYANVPTSPFPTDALLKNLLSNPD